MKKYEQLEKEINDLIEELQEDHEKLNYYPISKLTDLGLKKMKLRNMSIEEAQQEVKE